VPEDDQHNYVKKIDPGFAAGIYQVVAEGSRDVGQFSELLSVPEALGNVKGNGTTFGNSDVIVKRSEGLKLEWNTPSLLNDANIILVDVFAASETQIFHLGCGIAEKALLTGSATETWAVPADALAQLPATPQAEIRVTRGQEQKPRSGVFEGHLQGLRTMVAPTTLD
jgi:hypothetical protein